MTTASEVYPWFAVTNQVSDVSVKRCQTRAAFYFDSSKEKRQILCLITISNIFNISQGKPAFSCSSTCFPKQTCCKATREHMSDAVLSEKASLTLASPRLSCCERFRTGRPRLARRHAVRDKLALTHLVKDVNKEPLLLRLHPSKLRTLFYSRCTSLHLVHICHLCTKAQLCGLCGVVLQNNTRLRKREERAAFSTPLHHVSWFRV